MNQLHLGVIGAAGRGGSLSKSLAHFPKVRLHALCDLNAQALQKAAGEANVPAEQCFSSYEEMFTRGKIDAVIVGTPMPLHAAQCVAALERNIHVIVEVPAAVSVEECKQIVAATKASKAVFMMGENYTYTRANQTIKEMVRLGLFGRPYYAEAEYLHELKGLNEITKWRRHWQNGIDGITYGTHSLGPVLQWFPGERVVRVCCEGSGHHYIDPRNEPYAQDTSVMLGKMSGGGLVKIRVDMISDRPHAMQNYQLQGTDGAYESARSEGEAGRIWLRSLNAKPERWTALKEVWDRYQSEAWRKFEQQAGKSGHGGGDLLEFVDFFGAILDGKPTPVGVHEAMDMTLPGLISQQCMREGAGWLEVPDSRGW